MARSLHKLTDVYVRSTKLKPGRHSDGGGLYLNVGPTGGKSWLFMWVRDGKRREMGIGGYPSIGLAAARELAAAHRVTVAAGGDPLEQRETAHDQTDEPTRKTFADAVDDFLDSVEGGWRNEKHKGQWRMTLGDAYCKTIRSKAVADISTDDVLGILSPIWQTKNETASRLRGRIERVLDFARVKGWWSGENPAMWRGHLKLALPARQKLQRGHHAAMPYEDVPAFVIRLRAAEAMAARGLEFLILTAARSGEVLDAQWQEFDLDAGLWTVPAHRMKAGKEHRVPLSDRALEIVKALHEVRINDYVFPGQAKDRPLSNMSFHMLMRRMKVDDFTPHGFRSSFRDWCGDATDYPRELAEAALAHTISSAVERAYRRGDALEKRRKMMQAWADYVGGVVKDERSTDDK